jgi:hypothetical protein
LEPRQLEPEFQFSKNRTFGIGDVQLFPRSAFTRISLIGGILGGIPFWPFAPFLENIHNTVPGMISMEAQMGKLSNRIWIALVAAPLFAIGLIVGTALAQSKQAVPRAQDKQQLTDAEIKRILVLMDTDKNGKISKQEWMSFMEAEFNRLDTDKSGELDPKELSKSKLQTTFATEGK